MNAGFLFSKVPRAETRQCQSNKECQNYFCQLPSLPYCFDGVCKCGGALKAEATTCQSNKECQNVCEQPFGAFCIDGKCSCT